MLAMCLDRGADWLALQDAKPRKMRVGWLTGLALGFAGGFWRSLPIVAASKLFQTAESSGGPKRPPGGSENQRGAQTAANAR